MEINDIVGKKVAIWCDTEEKANDCFERLKKEVKTSMVETMYREYGENTCYDVKEKICFCEKEWYELEEWEIISYNDFFGISEQVESDTLTTVEIVEWLGRYYYDFNVMEKVFGEDLRMDAMLESLGAEEVVKRITDYEREQCKVKVSDEEITLLLNEKYGVGKWVRK